MFCEKVKYIQRFKKMLHVQEVLIKKKLTKTVNLSIDMLDNKTYQVRCKR